MEGVDKTFTSESDSANSKIPSKENFPDMIFVVVL